MTEIKNTSVIDFSDISDEQMNEMIDGTLTEFDEGDLVDGTVVKLEHDEVLVDIGFKSEGVIPARELSIRKDADPSDIVSLGDKIEALVLQKEDKDGRLILSKKRAEYERAWISVEEKFKAGEVVTGEVIEVVKGGLILDIGLRGFLPASLVDLRRVKDLDAYLGTEIEARVIEMDRNRNNVVLSRRVLLEEGRKNERAEILSKLSKGMRLKGNVSSIVDFGAFVELQPGLDGLVHISQCAQNRVAKVTDAVQEGQIVRVKVLSVDTEKKRISLGMKQIKPNPWELVGEKYPEGTILEGVIKNITEFGMFIGIEDGIDGLIHVSDISWTKKIRHPNELFKVGDTVQAKVLTVDQESEKFTLGIKQLTEDPWTNVPTAYPVGGLVKGIITNITDFGLFVEVEEGIEGLVHVSELSNKKVKTPAELYKEGEEIQAKIIHVSAEDRRLGLSIKQLKDEEERKKPREYSRSGPEAGQSLGDLLKQKFEESEN